MKRLLYIFAGLLLLLSGCVNEDFEQEVPAISKDGYVEVQFNVDIPEPEPVGTRAINENLISDLQLLVFDENGRFISRHTATLNGSSYTATLPQSSNKRIVHFIANYDWSGFSDQQAATKDERELIPPLQATNLVFWQRMVYNSGISAVAFSSQQVPLVRNMAKFSLVNMPLSGLLNTKFAVFNMASAGSVAPFNTMSREFESVITEPAGVTFTASSPFAASDVYGFERKNSTVTTNPTYVIVQGTYATVSYYYKIDLIDDAKNMYDIGRNVWFKIVIEGVTLPGYTTVEAAQNAPASNNISASVILQSYPTISDGVNVLSVDKTVVSFTTNGQTLNANATYKTVAGASLNSLVSVTLVQDANFPVVNGTVSYNTSTGNLTANINNVPANGVTYTATIKIEAGSLSRTIRLLLRTPFTFTNISITPSSVPSVSGSAAVLRFTVPAEADYLLPFKCYITSAYMTPDFGNVEVIYEDGVYKYGWKVTAVGQQTVNFKTNTNSSAETMFIEADLFQRGQVSYTNAGNVYRFSNVVMTPNPVNFGQNVPVTLRFTVPTTGTFRIYTANLNPVGGSVSGGYYTYTATSAGEQVVNFLTNKQNSAETIRLTGTNYLDYSLPLKNQLVNISGTLTYRTATTILASGTVTVSIGGKVVVIFNTSATGTYQASIEAAIGDVLTFTYVRSGTTYTVTQAVTTALMVISKTLI